ncbi:MAG: hypothetical protein E7463_08465 [Ruminococcaceae bacterium]|nr:hypothetical protein [Oscillospiraceae bacterium]
MSKWIPWPAYYDQMPLDLRGVFNDAPAGKHGFLQVEGDKFVFEDGTVGRFWGVNFNGAACLPEHDYAEKVARRLAQTGCNIVRFHQLDSEWHTPNIFQFTKGVRKGHTMEMDVDSLDRLDYLVSCLQDEGIYVYMDICTYRHFKAGDGVPSTVELPDCAKTPYVHYNRRMIELQKKFAYDFWTHVNPYTGLANKDNPVFVMGEIINECDMFSRAFTVEPYVSEFRGMYAKWLAEKGITDVDAATCDLNVDEEPLMSFKLEVQEAYYDEMMGFIKGLGVKIPLCGTNWLICGANVKAQQRGDYVDGHTYFYDWKWGEHKCANRRMTEVVNPALGGLAATRVAGMPFFVSEWDMPWPNAYRAESNLLYAATGLLNGWSGFTIHTYAYMSHLDRMDMLGKEASSGAIGGVAYREGIFSTWNDPAKFGLFCHAALMTRRGDVKKANKTLKVNYTDLKRGASFDAFTATPEQNQVAACFDGTGEIDQDVRVIPDAAGEVRSDTGELYRSWEKGYGTIDTPMTQVAYGLLEKQGEIKLGDVEIKAETDFAVIALSSLSEDAIGESDNIMMTTVGRAENTDAKFAGDYMVEYGHAPILAEVIKAEIKLHTTNPNLHVWAVNAEGMYHGQVPATYEDGVLSFTIGDQFPSVYYLIQAE